MTKVPPLSLRREDIPDLSTGERTDKLLRVLNQFGAAAGPLLNGGLSLTGNVKAFAKELTFTTRDPWSALSVSSPWLAGPRTPMVRKVGNKVETRGLLTVNSAMSGTIGFTLATTHAPTDLVEMPAAAWGSAFGVKVAVEGTNGTIVFEPGVTAVALDRLIWEAADATNGTNGVFPIRIRNELDAAPSHVWVTLAVDITTGREQPVAVGGVAWSLSGNQVVIHDIGNLFPGRKFRVTILVAAE